MKLSVLGSLAGAFAAVAADAHHPSALFHNDANAAAHRIPTSHESAVMGRRILGLSKLGELSTVFPTKSQDDLAGVPIGLMDYVGDCEDEGNPTLLAIKIATSFRNVEAGSNISLSMRWIPPYPPARRISYFSRLTAFLTGDASYNEAANATPDPVPYSAANLPRFSLMGYLEPINPEPVEAVRLAACFTGQHRDAKWWLPGNPIHESSWARLVVTHVYWIGGFGDRAYIGPIPLEQWKNVTKEEWSSIKLPGEEKGWSEWSVGASDEL
ncbi:pyridoxamine 5'-phosphate oxidase-domain-containing protein [Emericellopsis atlantica]|uniref:Pyridoxamine 5'-phosphate oxidase-domain-containing protein n=1 Tax=Emericellopsis atlantica TaxID=2614577 RepID=A0A9P8CSZ3_9HYPO|nr:pyridoxamine 5'-phosphate oxidase-domain-containing protein [Emericellopsis atlantica]KAG9258644.1 pyridoxamine 5'-phosphate oxidase-domain-containing protein [Emericellopsis atlantica]